MSRDEALNKTIGILTYHQVNFCKSKEAVANMNEIIDALEKIDQECVADKDINVTATDCIRRQAAIDAIGNVPDYDDGMVWEALSHAQRDVALLPSVTLQPKMGWWNKSMDDYSYFYTCSCCGQRIAKNGFGDNLFSPYCPECGAKMQEVEDADSD